MPYDIRIEIIPQVVKYAESVCASNKLDKIGAELISI